MHKLISHIKAATGTKDTLIKTTIMTQLSESVKEIQLCGMGENISMEIGEAANSLCTVLEAMFLHNLKDSLVHKAKRAVADIDERPEPSFWAPLLIISHREIIDQIHNLTQITTEIGQCRSWIRLALNDCLLSSYLMTIRNDVGALKPYYNTSAYIRDSELLDVAQRLIEGVENFSELNLPCNSSLLNQWSLPTLLLAGIWSPTLRTTPITSGVDIAQSLFAESSTPTNSLNSSSSAGRLWQMALDEDAALKIILGKDETVESVNIQSETSSARGIAIGNSLNQKCGWSFEQGQETSLETTAPIISSIETSTVELCTVIQAGPESSVQNCELNKSIEHSYNALIESYNLLGNKTPDLHSVWERFENGRKNDDNSTEEDNQALSNMGFEVLSCFPKSEAITMGKIARERGLDGQNYECCTCKEALGINTSKPQVCAFTGNYYCDNCMSKEPIPIPARIIHNWDFKPYPVSQYAFDYVEEIRDHPTIDFKIFNPYIYVIAKDLAKLQTLRIQLNYLRAYLYTCREPVIEQLQQQLWPREYLYEHIHQYSISDLMQIPGDVLAQNLQKVVNFCREHVTGCCLCSQKGFVCEICNNFRVLYPFDIDTTYQCGICNAVYHATCLNASQPCPKCKRRREREDPEK